MIKVAERENHLDYAKGIGIISVVYFHTLVGLEAAGLDLSNSLQWSIFFVASYQMPLFFFLAGLHAAQSLAARSTKSFVTNKLSRLIYPYVIWSLITGGIQVALSNYVNSSITVKDLLSIWYRPLPNQHYWFLATLFLMFMLFLIVFRISKRHYLPILIGIALAPYIFSLHSSERMIEKLFIHIPFFVLGIIYTQFHWDHYLPVVSYKYILAIIIVFLLYNFVVWHAIPQSVIPVTLILKTLGVAVVIMVSKYLIKLGRVDLIKVFGIYSMQIYLAHGLFLAGARIFMQKYLGVRCIWFHIPIELAMGLILPLLLYKLAIRYHIPYLFEIPMKKSIPVNV